MKPDSNEKIDIESVSDSVPGIVLISLYLPDLARRMGFSLLAARAWANTHTSDKGFQA